MRLLGELDKEKLAYRFSSFLLKEGIENVVEPFLNTKTNTQQFRIWIENEDDLEPSLMWYKKFQEDATAISFTSSTLAPKVIQSGAVKPQVIQKNYGWKIKVELRPLTNRFTLTYFFILLCSFLYLWNDIQEGKLLKSGGPIAVQVGLTPLQEKLLFDYPYTFQRINTVLKDLPLQDYKDINALPIEDKALLENAENTPMWRGVYDYYKHSETQRNIPTFEKIREGEFWRLFTPCLLHRDFLHILFNMAWVLILGKQIEERIRKWRFLLLIVVSAIVSNVAQYVVSGPFFLGFSGVVIAMAGFIWMRQRVAPWEGYPLQRSTAFFLLLFVLAMFILEIGSFLLQVFGVTNLSANIANTAHIAGGLVGMLMARIPFLSKGGK